jgi:hypothetical protein
MFLLSENDVLLLLKYILVHLITKPFEKIEWLRCFFLKTQVTHFTPTPWGEMGHQKIKKKWGVSPRRIFENE